jgi:hypothetical protein
VHFISGAGRPTNISLIIGFLNAAQLTCRTTIKNSKDNLSRALSSVDVDGCLDVEASHHVHCAKTEDHQKLTQGFYQKAQA